MQAARKEAREMILAFMAGAEPVPATGGIKRTGTSGAAAGRNQILYRYRTWVLSDSELATAAVVTPPLPSEPKATPYVEEYKQFRDGPYVLDGTTAPDSDTMIRRGFGLRNPDADGVRPSTRNDLKPVMTVIYAPGNDMLHAFRAGPSIEPQLDVRHLREHALHARPEHDCGGEELWGFVPFDQLNALALLYRNQPQTRANHVYMLARGIRFSDVFVPQALTSVAVGGKTIASLQGVWRRILYFGRGIGGKYVTALDVTAPGPSPPRASTRWARSRVWNRGNPDTPDGLVTNADEQQHGPGPDRLRRDGPDLVHPGGGLRGPGQPDLPLDAGEAGGRSTTSCSWGPATATPRPRGRTFYTLDALTGDVIASADVESGRLVTFGLTRALPYAQRARRQPGRVQPEGVQRPAPRSTRPHRQ